MKPLVVIMQEKKQKHYHDELVRLSQESALDKIQEVAALAAQIDQEVDLCYASFIKLEEELSSLQKQLPP